MHGFRLSITWLGVTSLLKKNNNPTPIHQSNWSLISQHQVTKGLASLLASLDNALFICLHVIQSYCLHFWH